tara:strand:+ start:382 stop:558 length:177 start_codon:yes stop_codon:yes gene_type:complete
MKIKSVKYIKPIYGDVSTTVSLITESDEKWSVPVDENNRHYQAVLEWVEEGNTIEEAD